MARDGRGPANNPMASLQQQIHRLEDRVKELEQKRVLSAPVSNLDKTRDAVEGEHMIDHRDSSAMWFVNEEWRYGLPGCVASFTPSQTFPFEPFKPDREYQDIEMNNPLVFSNSENYYMDEDFPARIYLRTPGTYLTLMYFGMSNIEGLHGIIDLGVTGDGLSPDGIAPISVNPWFSTSLSSQSSGDPTLDETVDPGDNIGKTYLGIFSFWANEESFLDLEEDPDDEEAPFPTYTRWLIPRLLNNGPDEFEAGSGNFAIFRLGNRHLV
jgi:hypothetical protein